MTHTDPTVSEHENVLVNNAANFFGGFFEELSPQQVRSQIETNLFGPMTVTRAVLAERDEPLAHDDARVVA